MTRPATQESVGATIRSIRVDKGLTIRQVARSARVHENYLGTLENGRRDVSLSVLTRVAKALDVKVSAFLGEVPKPSAQAIRFGRELEQAPDDLKAGLLALLRAKVRGTGGS